MASGLINTCCFIPLAGLGARTTDRSAQYFSLFTGKTVDAGYVTREKRLPVFLWNGSAAGITLADIIGNEAAEGIAWTPDPPRQIPRGAGLAVIITVGTKGPLEFQARLSFLSACAIAPILIIAGTRVPQISGDIGYLFFPHNWQEGFNETLAWKTDVLTAHDGTEQRVRLRTMPRRIFDLRMLAAGSARRRLEGWLSLRRTRFLLTPVWRDVQRLQAPIAAGDTIIPLNPRFLDYAAGRQAAVFDAWDRFEIRTVTGIGAGFVSVDAPFERRWPQGSMAAPCRHGLALAQRRIGRFTEEAADYRVSFEAADESLMPAVQNPDLYRQIPCCPFVPSWEGPEDRQGNRWLQLDNETGLVEYDILSIEPVLSRDAVFRIIGRERIDRFLRFLFAAAGRLAPFWLAANDRAFEPAPAKAGDIRLTIAGIGYEYALQGSPARSHIELIAVSGEVIRRMITGVETLPGGDERWTLNEPLPMDISGRELNRCAWLEPVRLDTDTINLRWLGWDCLEATLPVMVLT
ncbi:MAG: hypothetical protein P4L42_15415 [Desulfocapsaceae bacterium]|nr:hypothetical protein [Desulfocapsaceae bacterium]